MAAAAEKYAKYLKYVFIAAPALAGLYLIMRYGVNVVRSDEWFMIYLGERVQTGTLTFSDLWLPFIEHRQLFFRLIYLAVAFLTGFNSKAQLFVSFAIVCAGYFVLIKYVFSKVKSELWRCAGGFVLGLLLFSPVQFENFLWCFQMPFFLSITLPLISMYLLHRRLSTGKRRYFVVAIVLAVVATFSSAQGLLVWPAALAMFVLHFRKAIFKQGVALGWLIAGAVSWFLYFFQLSATVDSYNTLPVRDHLLHIAEQPLAFLATIARMAVEPLLSKGDSSAGFTGIFNVICILAAVGAVALSGFKLITRYRGDNFFPGAVALLGIMSIVAISYGREIWEITRASRYTTETLFIYIGAVLYALTSLELPKGAPADAHGKKPAKAVRLPKHTAAVLLSALVLVSTVTWPWGFTAGRGFGERMSRDAVIVVNYRNATHDDLMKVFGEQGRPEMYIAIFKKHVPFLERNGYNVFSK